MNYMLNESKTKNSYKKPKNSNNGINDYIDTQEEKALLRKLDRWIVPPVMLLYLFSLVLPSAKVANGCDSC